jgi:N-acetylglutamate synthase-like GNAT family acetyltransferase
MPRMAAAVPDLRVRTAGAADSGAIASLVNQAFSVERFFVDGERTDEAEVRELMARGSFLCAEVDGELVGCVFLERRGERGYFGMLSVSPSRQKAGIGRLLVDRCEAHFRAAGCTAVDIKIVHLRSELPPFYRALGYRETGTAPFVDDSLTQAAHFVLMSKPL